MTKKRDRRWWYPKCPTCGSEEVDFAPFSQGREWECQDCGMKFDQSGILEEME